MTAQGIGDNTITRNAGARIFLPTEDEWYKAAFYDGSSDSYFDYPAGSDAQTMCALPGAAANTANCNSAVGDFTNVGSYPGSASPYGTLDQGGNTQEWNETIFHELDRGIRGGSFFASPDDLTAAPYVTSSPTGEVATKGFRLASPVPAVPSLSPVGLLLVAAGLLGFGVYRRSRE
jgi:formylglycine-generating enzyme required for sulfatase activity